jgi:hypothetical protein
MRAFAIDQYKAPLMVREMPDLSRNGLWACFAEVGL